MSDKPAWQIPGDGNPDGSDPGTWVACGHADGVIFLGDVYDTGASSNEAPQIVSAGYERQSLRYLKNPDSDPQAKAWRTAHHGELGFAVPDIAFLLNKFPQIYAEAEEQCRPIERIFLANKMGVNANATEHAPHWRVEKVEDGIWAVFYER